MCITFTHRDHNRYNTTSIYIGCAGFSTKKCEILETEKTKYGHYKVVIRLSEEKAKKMKEYEHDANLYLEDMGVRPIKLVYGNKIYVKSHSKKAREYIRLKGIYVDRSQKASPQIWLEW